MFNVDNITNEKNKEHNKKWPYIPYQLTDGEYKLLWSKSNQKESNIVEQKSDIEVFKQKIEDKEKEINKKLF